MPLATAICQCHKVIMRSRDPIITLKSSWFLDSCLFIQGYSGSNGIRDEFRVMLINIFTALVILVKLQYGVTCSLLRFVEKLSSFSVSVCMVCMALLTAEILCARTRDPFVSVNAWDTCRFSYMRRLLITQNYGIEPSMLERMDLTSTLPACRLVSVIA